AIATLQPMGFAKTVLQHAQAPVRLCEALDRRDPMAVGLHRIHQTGADRLAIEHDGACPADAVLAANMRTGEIEMLAQPIHERGAGRDLADALRAVDLDRDGIERLAHDTDPTGTDPAAS